MFPGLNVVCIRQFVRLKMAASCACTELQILKLAVFGAPLQMSCTDQEGFLGVDLIFGSARKGSYCQDPRINPILL